MSASFQSNQQQLPARAAQTASDFATGFRFFFAGLPLLFKHRRLLALSLVPILLTLVLLTLLAFGFAWLIGELTSGLANGELRIFFQALGFLLGMIVGFSLYLPLARVLLAPLSESLSRQTHEILHGPLSQQRNLGWARAMWEGLKLVSLQLVILFLAFLLSFAVPVVGHLLWVALAIMVCGLDFLDVPLSVRGLRMRAKLGLLWRRKWLTLGFGTAGYLLLFIPVINLLALPVGVTGATLLIDRLEREAQQNHLIDA